MAFSKCYVFTWLICAEPMLLKPKTWKYVCKGWTTIQKDLEDMLSAKVGDTVPLRIIWRKKIHAPSLYVWLSSDVDRVWLLCRILLAHTDGRRREITRSRTIVLQDPTGSVIVIAPCWFAMLSGSDALVAMWNPEVSNQKALRRLLSINFLSPERVLVWIISTCNFPLPFT